jgi:flavin-dependent dehydrogenase
MGRPRKALEVALAVSPLTAARVRELARDVRTVSAATTALEHAAGGAWIAVGDAALAHDPLAGQGLLFALRSATAAARAIEGHLAGDLAALWRYDADMRREAREYLVERRAVYAAQPRWRDMPFWSRRSALSDTPGETYEQAG